MTITCKNCSTVFKGNYCYNCGQPAHTHRLDLHSIWHDIQHGLLHIDKGIFYTITQLFTKPGHSIRGYLEGKRVKHFKPVSLVIILATVYALVNHFLKLNIVNETDTSIESSISGVNFSFSGAKSEVVGIKEFIESHFALLQVLMLPYYALATRLAFLKSGYNYIEHLVINAFFRGQIIIITTLFLPLVYWGFISKDTGRSVTLLIEMGCFFWIFIQLFKTRRVYYVIIRLMLAMFYFVAGQFIILNIILYTIKIFSWIF
jgi:hypothetical protein